MTAIVEQNQPRLASEGEDEELRRAILHQAAGRFDEAEKLLDQLLKAHPDNPTLRHYQGMNLYNTGQREEGRELVGQALQDMPGNPVQITDYGSVLAQSGDLDGAIEHFREAVETAPNYAIAQSNLGGALVLKDRFAEAVRHLKKAIELNGQLIDAHTNLAVAYMQTRRFDEAVEILFKALSIDPQSVGAHIQLAAALYRRERYESAEYHAQRAIELAPEAAEAYLHLANSQASSGRMEEATENLLKIATNHPVGIMALSRLIHLRKTTPDAPEMKILAVYLRHIDKLLPERKATLHFAAGKAYDDLGDCSDAFAHFRKANDLNKELHPFDGEAFVERSERLRAFQSPALIKRCGGGGLDDVAPIFICGMPRSGTTLMDQMFSRHPEVQAGGELRSVPVAMQQNRRIRDALEEKLIETEIMADDFKRLAEDYVASVRQEGIRSEFFTDKMPSNYLYAAMLALAMPRARFLIMRRHPMGCLFSNYMQHFGQNQPFSSDFKNLGIVYREFDKMARHWSECLPDRVREVSYEEVIADPEGQMRTVLDFVGLDWTPEVLDFKASFSQVNTASLSQVRQPIYSDAVARWRR
ncbi:MAG: tetratricopeptide repeat protein, partial [Rhodobacteraceae bacterium]|nr:tetratricopeptide repeat protein [Paracoccaceae bacterium]